MLLIDLRSVFVYACMGSVTVMLMLVAVLAVTTAAAEAREKREKFFNNLRSSVIVGRRLSNELWSCFCCRHIFSSLYKYAMADERIPAHLK